MDWPGWKYTGKGAVTSLVRIAGLGLDLAEVSRLRLADERLDGRLVRRLFTERELAEATPAEGKGVRWATLAGKWAAKEAVVKAMGTGFSGMSWKDIEITRDELGRPCVALSGGAAERAHALGIEEFQLSITHEGGLAAASAIAVKHE